MRAVTLILAAIALAACATTRDIAEQSAQANLGIEQAQNRMLVLNTLRAAKRRPMYFTSIVSLSVPAPRVAPTVGVTLPLSAEAAGAAVGIATLRSELPSFNVAVLDGQKFIAGITTPLKPSLVRYHFEQRWPPMLLLSLLIREISHAAGPAGSELTLPNNPEKKAQFDAFQAELRAMLACGLKFVEDDLVSGTEAPTFELPDASHLLSALSATAREGFVVVPHQDAQGLPTGRWQLARPRADVLLFFSAPFAPACLRLPPEQRRRLLRSNEASTAEKGAVMDFLGPGIPRRSIRLMVRSPEAILSYMGELVRVAYDGDADRLRYVPQTTIDLAHELTAPIFKLSRDGVPDAFISVEYDGEQHSIAPGPEDRSSQSLTLVSLLIGLQKEASEVPLTAPIRLIGQ